MNTPPLVVDLDDTLLKTDLLFEALLCLLRQQPWCVFWLLPWYWRGRAYLKAQIAARVVIDPKGLPYRTELLTALQAERAQGRSLILATASPRTWAMAIADHLQLFDDVMASDAQTSLKGPQKATALVQRFGRGGFDYVGDSRADLAVWAVAARAWVVGTQQPEVTVVRRFLPTESRWRMVLRAMRLHQWTKNALLFVPLFTSHQFFHLDAVVSTGLALIAFSLCASSVYLLNDLWDLGADRQHSRKCHRPFAAGHLKILEGLLLIPILLILAFTLAISLLSWKFVAVLLFYYGCTLFYSFCGKAIPIIDVLFLAGLYTLRILAGDAALNQFTSFWLLAFSIFFFLSLAMVKRYAELAALPPDAGQVVGRGYAKGDEALLRELGAVSGYCAVLVLALYIKSPEVLALYRYPWLLWSLCPLLLYWITRVWFITHRGEMHDDPIVFAIQDRLSHLMGLATLIIVLIASHGR